MERSVIREPPSRCIIVPGLRCAPSGLRNNETNKRKRNAGRRVLNRRAPAGARRALSGARSPVGVPPRHLRQRTNAAAQLQSRASWVQRHQVLPASSPIPVQRVASQAGRHAGRAYNPEPPGSRGDEPPPAGTALVPSSRSHRLASFTETRFAECSRNSDQCQASMSQ